jgi:MFS family permease
MENAAPPSPPRHTHPAVYMVLIVPFGAMGGYLSVAVAYLLNQAGITLAQMAPLLAIGLIPHTWKFLWAPIADTTLTRKKWYLIAAVLSAVGIFGTGALPMTTASLPRLSAIVVISNLAVTFLGMAVESLMAYATPEDEKGRAGGWFQAGNLGGYGLGGGLGLILAQRLPAPWMAAALVALACLACSLALLFIKEPPPSHSEGRLTRRLMDVGVDLWQLARSRNGLLTLFLCVLPIGSGAASGLWSAVAGDWQASANTVAVATGVLGGIVSAVGCLAGGWVCDRMNRKAAYAAYGVLQALCAVAMAAAPRSESMYVFFTLLYAFITGLTFAGFTAFVLEAMGKGAAATKYNVYASLSNTPIYYMTRIDGWAHGRWGAGGMLKTEAAFGAAGLVAFLGVAALLGRRLRPARTG